MQWEVWGILMRPVMVGLLVGGTIASVNPVLGNDVSPGFKTPAAVAADNWTISADGMYQSVPLPKSSLGWHGLTGGADLMDSGALQTVNPRLDGAAGRGAIGYIVPNSAYRLELGGSYASASGTFSQTRPSQGFDIWNPVLLSGFAPAFGANCIPSTGFRCTLAGALQSSYESWQLFGKAAYDLKVDTATLTPSVAVFGGSSRVNQTLSQTFAQVNGAGATTASGTYSAATRQRWSDVGARLGLEIAAPTPVARLTMAVSGWVGAAARRVDLNGSDVNVDTTSGTNASAISSSASTVAFLANLEGRVSYAFAPNVTVRIFGGANVDSRVPGISTPGYSSTLVTQGPVPAQISYSSEVAVYGGGGFAWLF